MPESSPWDEIAVPASDFNVRQLPNKTVVPCFWGRDHTGACLFIVELQGDHAALFRKDVVTVKGIGVDLRSATLDQQLLIVTLERQIDRDLFDALCRSLGSALEYAADSVAALAISLTHIRRWKTFFSGSVANRLSPEEIRGLFAELTFLIELLDEGVKPLSVITAWLGPERSQQDFSIGNRAIEIKSLSGSERNVVRISSEDQLESLKDHLFLRIYRLSNLTDAKGALSLNGIVETVQARLDSEAVAIFDRKLVAHRYAPLPDYGEPLFVISDMQTYRVQGDFPRIVRSRLDHGIKKVNYDIELEHLAPYKCDDAFVFKEL